MQIYMQGRDTIKGGLMRKAINRLDVRYINTHCCLLVGTKEVLMFYNLKFYNLGELESIVQRQQQKASDQTLHKGQI